MAKTFTAQEMRRAANLLASEYFCNDAIAMLRQAADAMESEAKREKRYEYAKMFFDGTVSSRHNESPEEIEEDIFNDRRIARREVGEWEEVKE